MKAREVPTSPKFQSAILREKEKHYHDFRIAILSIVIGVIAGALSSLIVLSTMIMPMFFFDGSQIIVKDQIAKSESFEQSKEEINEFVKKTVGLIVKTKKSSEETFAFDPPLEDDILGTAISLTNDGWMLATKESSPEDILGGRVLFSDGSSVPIIKSVEDPKGPFLFIQGEKQGMTPFEFVSENDAVDLRNAWYVLPKIGGRFMIKEVSVLDPWYAESKTQDDFIHSTDQFEGDILIDASMLLTRGIIVDDQGKVIGLGWKNDSEGFHALPTWDISPLFDMVFQKGKIERLSFGASWIDPSLVQLKQGELVQKEGALVYSFDHSKGIEKNSIAEKGGLKPFDLVLSVDGTVISKQQSFTDFIQRHNQNDPLRLEIIRGAERMNLLF